MRLSLGAGLARIAQQLMTESMLLSAIGCMVGLLIAWSVLRLLARVPNLPLPRMDEVHLNGPALLATVAVTIATTLLFGWIPSLSVSQLSLSSALRTRGGERTGRRRSSLSLLVVTEIACSVVLTVSVGLLVHSFWRVIHVDPVFKPSRCSEFIYGRITTPKKVAFFGKACSPKRLSLPGVRHAALSDWRPGRDAAISNVRFRGPTERSNSPAFR